MDCLLSTDISCNHSGYHLKMANSIEKQYFSKRLIELCENKNLPLRGRQSVLKKLCGVKQQSVSKWFNAEAIPEYEHCLKLCDYFGVNFEWFIAGKGNKYRKDVDDNSFMQEQFGRDKENISVAESGRIKEFLTLPTELQIKIIGIAKEDQTDSGHDNGERKESDQS